MTVEIADRVAFLKKIHLFIGLEDDQLAVIAAELQERAYQAGEAVIKQGQEAHHLFLIYSGTARVMRMQNHQEQQLAVLVPEDYFGEEELFVRERRVASVYIQTDALLLVLARKNLQALLVKIHKLRPNFEVAISSRRLARKLQFDWLEPGEAIYFLARKHPVLLWEAMIAPALLLLLPIGLLVVYLLFTSLAFVYGALVVFLIDIAWIIWRVVDWGNDYYIVTNLRVIWLEKVVALYDSRQEAPLTTVLSVGVETDQAGRMLDYGNVVIRTFVGRISFHHVSHPYQAATMIEEQWNRTRNSVNRANVDALKRSIRQKLGLPVEESSTSTASSPAPKLTTNKISILRNILDRVNIFKVRFEDKGGTITYRKHWIVLFLQTWLPTLLFLVSLVLAGYRLSHLTKAASGAALIDRIDPLLLILLVALVFAFFWWVYQYWDWSNDIFQVTLDQIFDIDRKPLGREERKSAPLDNILSTDAERRGLIQILFNYGNVYISIGKENMDFFDVYDPSGVQQDIDRRRMARIDRRRQADVDAERERLADFFAMYHQSTEEFRHDLSAQHEPQPPSAASPEEPIVPKDEGG